MEIDAKPDFVALAHTSISIFHPEILTFPDDVIEKAVAKKAADLEAIYNQMLAERKNGL